LKNEWQGKSQARYVRNFRIRENVPLDSIRLSDPFIFADEDSDKLTVLKEYEQ
jgi:hypothetical protein